jgi:hypothetical protein
VSNTALHTSATCQLHAELVRQQAAARAIHSCRDVRRSWGQVPLDREHSATAVVDMGTRDTNVTTCQSYSLGSSEWLRAVALAAQQVGVTDPLAYFDHVEVPAAAPWPVTLTAPTLTAPTRARTSRGNAVCHTRSLSVHA